MPKSHESDHSKPHEAEAKDPGLARLFKRRDEIVEQWKRNAADTEQNQQVQEDRQAEMQRNADKNRHSGA